MDFFFQSLNNNKFFSGCLMLFMNIGGRYITMDIPKTTDNLFKNKFLRYLVVFSISFIATHDIKISILLTLLFILIFKFLLDNNSKSCILPNSYINDIKIDKQITENELKHASNILKKYHLQKINKNNIIY